MNVVHYLTLAINPFLGFIASLFRYDKKSTKVILWLFTMIYGYTFVISNETMDANRRKGWYELITGQNLSWFETLKYFYIDNDNATDFIEPLIYSVTAQVFPTFNGLMLVLGCIFGFFYGRNIDFVYRVFNFKQSNPFAILFLACFPFVIGFWEINMFRFFMCAILYFYAVFPYLISGNRRSLIWLVFIPFIHFTYWLPVILLLFYIYFKNKPKLYFSLLVIGLLFSFIDVTFIGDIMKMILPSNFHSKIDLYTNSNYHFGREKLAKNWAYYAKRLFYYVEFILLVCFYKYNMIQVKKDKAMYRLFNFCLLFSAFSFFMLGLPEGDRFVRGASLFNFAFFVFYLSYNKTPNFIKIGNVIILPLALLFIFAFIRDSFNTINSEIFYNNTIVMLIHNAGKALVEIL